MKPDLVVTRLHAFSLFAFSAFVCFSIAGAHISLGLLSVCVVLQVMRRKKEQQNGNGTNPASRFDFLRLGLEWPLAIFFLSALVSTALSAKPLDSFLHLKHLLIAAGAYAVAYSLRFQPAWRTPVLWIFLSTATLASLWGLLELALGWSRKVQSTQSTTMTWGAMCAMFTLITLQAALTSKAMPGLWSARLFFLPQLLALLLSLVRGAYLGFAAGAVYLLHRHWKRLLPAAIIILVVAGLLMPAIVRERITSMFDLQNTTILVRLTQWRIATEIIADHPFFGVGLHDLAYLTRQYAWPDPALPEIVNQDVFHIGHYHSTYFTLAVCFGLVGLLAFGGLVFRLAQSLGKALRHSDSEEAGAVIWACRAALISFLVAGGFDWTFGDAEVITMFWFLAGMGLGQSRRSE